MFSFRICMSILYIYMYIHIYHLLEWSGMIRPAPPGFPSGPMSLPGRLLTITIFLGRFLKISIMYGSLWYFFGEPVPTTSTNFMAFFFGEDVGRFLQSAAWLWMCFKHSTDLDMFVNKFMGCLIDFVNCKTEPLAWSCFRNVSNILMSCAADVSLP